MLVDGWCILYSINAGVQNIIWPTKTGDGGVFRCVRSQPNHRWSILLNQRCINGKEKVYFFRWKKMLNNFFFVLSIADRNGEHRDKERNEKNFTPDTNGKRQMIEMWDARASSRLIRNHPTTRMLVSVSLARSRTCSSIHSHYLFQSSNDWSRQRKYSGHRASHAN